MKVPLLDLKAQYAQIQTEVEAATLKVLRDTKYILGPEVGELECALAGFTGAKHVVGCASGSDALLLALMALNIGAGDEVITTPHTFFATAGAVARLGAKPVFVDVDPRTYNIAPDQVAAKITARTKAIIPVHLFGQCADLDPIVKLGIPVIEDAAQAIGALYKGKQAGTGGAMGTFSFFPSKNLGGAGDGGAISTNDAALAEQLRVLRVHGSKPKYYHSFVGINSRLDTLQAAIVNVKLKYLNGWTEGRRRNAAHYDKRFKELGVEQLVNPPYRDPNCFHIFNQYTLRVARRDALRDHLKKNDIGTEIYYPVPLHLQKCFAYLGHKPGDFPVAEKAAAESLSLPIYPELTTAQLDFVAETVAAFVKS
jgi:dTDP-4-amino-4,6-dideoxygalactose transaminase